MKSVRSVFDPLSLSTLFSKVSTDRIHTLARLLEVYISKNLSAAIENKSALADYRTNPYVLMACGGVMNLDDPNDFARFLVDTKLYMGLETSFGKSVESIVMGAYPINARPGASWADPPEKLAEFAALKGLSREAHARARGTSLWREIDRACVSGRVRYLTTIKSGPNTINDTQVNAMKDAIRDHHRAWLDASRQNYGIDSIDVVLGLTYGTAKTTNNKDCQLIVKLLECGFKEEDRANKPGVLVDEATGQVRVYRVVGANFWSFAADPSSPMTADFAFLEVLLALALALCQVSSQQSIEDRLNARLQMLSRAIGKLSFPRGALPLWIVDELTERELFGLASAMTAFYDQGI